MTSARIESSLPGEIEAEPEPLVQDVEVSLIVQVTAVEIPSSWRVNVRELAGARRGRQLDREVPGDDRRRA